MSKKYIKPDVECIEFYSKEDIANDVEIDGGFGEETTGSAGYGGDHGWD